MRVSRVWLFILFLASSQGNSFVSAKDVIEITSDTYRNHVFYKSGYILFYAPWCGHCKSIKPLWEELANDPDIKYEVSQIDCTIEDHSNLVYNNRIKGYPTIKFHHDGKFYTYPYKRRIGPLRQFAENILSGNPEVDAEKVAGGILTFTDFVEGMSKVSPFLAMSAVTYGAGAGILAVLIFWYCCLSSEEEFEEMLNNRREEIEELNRKRKENEPKSLGKDEKQKGIKDDTPKESKKDR